MGEMKPAPDICCHMWHTHQQIGLFGHLASFPSQLDGCLGNRSSFELAKDLTLKRDTRSVFYSGLLSLESGVQCGP